MHRYGLCASEVKAGAHNLSEYNTKKYYDFLAARKLRLVHPALNDHTDQWRGEDNLLLLQLKVSSIYTSPVQRCHIL